MFKILQARIQSYTNWEIPVVQAGFRKIRRTRDQIANIHWMIEKARKFHKNIYFCFIDYTKVLDWVGYNKLWKILWEMGLPDQLTYLLGNVYVGQEASCSLYGTTHWFRVENGVWPGCLLSPCLFSSYAEHIMRDAGLHELQVESRLPAEISTTSGMQMISL